MSPAPASNRLGKLPPGESLFLAALRWQESGSPIGNYREPNGQGAYQIIQSNWPSWARTYAGYQTSDPNASDAPAAVQDVVAAAKVKEYFYGAGEQNWRLVARIWNGGSPNPVPNPALGPGATTDTYASQLLAKAAALHRAGDTGQGNLGATGAPGSYGAGLIPGYLAAIRAAGWIKNHTLPHSPGSPLLPSTGTTPGEPGFAPACHYSWPSKSIDLKVGHIGPFCFDGLAGSALVLAGGGLLATGLLLLFLTARGNRATVTGAAATVASPITGTAAAARTAGARAGAQRPSQRRVRRAESDYAGVRASEEQDLRAARVRRARTYLDTSPVPSQAPRRGRDAEEPRRTTRRPAPRRPAYASTGRRYRPGNDPAPF